MKAYQNLYITGSINVTGSGITGSLFGTASYTETASYVGILTQPVTISGSVQISGSLLINGEEPGTGGGTTVTISGSAPSGSATGSLWFNNDDLNLYVQYYDGTGSYWVPSYNNQSLYANSASFAATASSLVNTIKQDLTLSGSILISGSLLVNGVAPGAGGGATVTISGSRPSGSKDSGSLWWNETDGNLYIQVTSPTGSTYVPATNTVAGGNYGATLTTARTGSVWNINHNLNTTTPLVTVYSGSSVMIPASITSVDANNTQITFSGSVVGSAILSTGIGNETTNNAVSASYATTSSNTTQITDTGAASGYVDIGRMRIQWGIDSQSTSTPTVTLPVAFSSSIYSVAFTEIANTNANLYSFQLASRTTTNFTVRKTYTNGINGIFLAVGEPISWIAIGLKP